MSQVMASSQSVLSKNKTTYTWNIEKFSTLNAQQRSQDFLNIVDRKLIIDLAFFPKESSDKTSLENHFVIYLIIRGGSNELNVHYALSLLDENGEKRNTKEGTAKIANQKIESNWQYTISRDYVMDKANGLLIDDTLKVHCELYVIDNPNPTNLLEKIQDQKSSIKHDLFELFKSKKYSDVIVMAGEKQFPAHKLILSSRSPVFAAMFEHECQESKQNRVQITDVDANTLEQLLRYIYTDKCSALDQYSADLMVAADKYQMNALKSICEQSLSSNLTIESALQYLILADKHSAQQLGSNCLDYITKHCFELNRDLWQSLITAAPKLSFTLYESVAIYAMRKKK